MMAVTLHIGTVAYLRGNPFESEQALDILQPGALVVTHDGRIQDVGEHDLLLSAFPHGTVVDHGSAWIFPGLIDAHLHFPQFYATAGAGHGLLDWLNRTVFPAEMAYIDEEFAAITARNFIKKLLASGTTTAFVFGSQFFHANLSLLEAAEQIGLRLISGMTLMDRNAPPELLQNLDQITGQIEQLRARCRANPLLHYAITPRFALSCSPELLRLCGYFLNAYPETYLQTHINETAAEIEAVHEAFPDHRTYTEVYEHFGLLTARSLFAHSVHSSDHELVRLAATGCTVCHCPTSNLYLGSGLFPMRRHLHHGIKLALGSDIGAGTRFSIWRELAEAYKIQQLQGFRLNAAQLLYLATLGAAVALQLGKETGNFEEGKSADFFVLDYEEDDYLNNRLKHCDSLEDQLFCLLQLADESHIKRTYVQGKNGLST
jgi:guanine deaminase